MVAAFAVDAVAAQAPRRGHVRVVLHPAKPPKKSPVPAGSAWAKVQAKISPDGEVSTATALQAFALAVAPLPGVHAPSGAKSNVAEGGETVRWVIAHWDDLTPAQQAAVQKALTGSPTPTGGGGGPGRSVPSKGVDVSSIVTEMLARYDAPLGPLSIPVKVTYLESKPDDVPDGTEAMAEPVNGSGTYSGPPASCDVKITPFGASTAGSTDFEMVIAHELFHCYQAVWLGLDRYYTKGSSWAIEGSATWAGYNVAPEPPSEDNNWWLEYLATAPRALFSRAHDAVGFFGQVAQAGVDLWPLFPQFFQTVGDVARYHVLADAAGDKLLDAWGPGYWMNSELSPPWRVEGKAVPASGPSGGNFTSVVNSIVVADNETASVKAAPYTVALYAGQPTADVTEVQIGGHARLADQKGFDSTDLSDTYLCTKSDGKCECPDDTTDISQGLPASIQPVKGFLWLGVTGATDGAKGTVLGMSLKNWCKKRHQKKATTSCEVLTVATIDKITGLHITNTKDNGDSCVYGDPSAPVNPVLQQLAGIMSQAFQGSNVTTSTGAGVIVRLTDLPDGPDPQVSDYFDEIPADLCDPPQLIDGVNGATTICQGVENIVVVSDGKFVHIVYLASGNGATHEVGAALGAAADERL
jgi:hypothetical protein